MMIKIENTDVYGFQHAIRGMRNAFRSWDKSDSHWVEKEGSCWDGMYFIGSEDFNLMKKLGKAGSDEAKYRRMIVVYADITAPLYWWKEYDTYKVGTVALSESTMHSIADKEFTIEDFSVENLGTVETPSEFKYLVYVPPIFTFQAVIEQLNHYRSEYLKNKDKSDWWQMIQLLPSSYNQHRTVMLNYEVLANMYRSRRNHKLDEWHDFCTWARELPYSEIFTGEGQS